MSEASDRIQGRVVWTPPEGKTRLDAFRERVNKEHSLQLANYEDLYQWSIASLSDFWQAVWDELGVVASAPANEVLPQDPKMFPPVHWFSGARLNFAENVLRHGRDEDTALIHCTELASDTHKVSYAELRRLVGRAVHALRSLGVGVGDTVASYSSNSIENMIAFLATSAVGAVWTSVAPDFGTSGVLERLMAVRPCVLFSINAVMYNGKLHDHVGKLDAAVEGLLAMEDAEAKEAEGDDEQARSKRIRREVEHRLEHVVVAPYAGSHPERDQRKNGVDGYGAKPRRWLWTDFLQAGAEADGKPTEFEQLDFNHPLWVLFSSGTTGKPKAITHRAGGMLLQFGKEHLLHGGLTRDDVFFQHTSTGWMMWNWLVGALLAGCPVVLYDGSPAYPVSVLWERAAELGITVFGTSAAYLSLLQRREYYAEDLHDRLRVRMILSTGSPLRAELYPFAERLVGHPVLVGSITGGTDLCSLFATMNVSLPVRAGELQCCGLGMAVDVFDGQGRSLPPGEEGDLVCKKPFPVQPVGFWHQPNERYYESYYSQIPGVWYHGDLVTKTEHGGLVMLGRSDGILNPSGIRFGSAEIYEVLENKVATAKGSLLAQIHESLVVALKTPAHDDEVVVLFLLVDDSMDDAAWEQLVDAVRKHVRSQLSARHVPAYIRRIHGVPKTLNGKRVEVPVKKRRYRFVLPSVLTAQWSTAPHWTRSTSLRCSTPRCFRSTSTLAPRCVPTWPPRWRPKPPTAMHRSDSFADLHLLDSAAT